MIDLLKTTVAAVATEFKLYLPDILPHMLKVFITDKSEDRVIIREVQLLPATSCNLCPATCYSLLLLSC